MAIPNREAPPANQSLEARLARVEDQLAIRDLTARYNFAMDNRDLASASLLFMPDGSFGSKDGAMRATGIDAIVKQFEGRFSVLGATNHFAHDHVIWFESPPRARGTPHAEAAQGGAADRGAALRRPVCEGGRRPVALPGAAAVLLLLPAHQGLRCGHGPAGAQHRVRHAGAGRLPGNAADLRRDAPRQAPTPPQVKEDLPRRSRLRFLITFPPFTSTTGDEP